jgi:hypothetical protein
MDLLLSTLAIGAGATALVDLWAVVRTRLLDVPPPNYAYLGRWLAHMRHARFRHDAIAAARPMRGERAIGWIAHYAIGIAFAALLPAFWSAQWLRNPTPGPALIVGLFTVAAPFLLMQPGMGAGIAAHRTARPAAARMQSLVTHAIFGVGLYVTAWLTSHLIAT